MVKGVHSSNERKRYIPRGDNSNIGKTRLKIFFSEGQFRANLEQRVRRTKKIPVFQGDIITK